MNFFLKALAIGFFCIVAGYFSNSSNRFLLEKNHNTSAKREAANHSLDRATHERWETYDLVAALDSVETKQAALKKLQVLLAENPQATFERLSQIPERHPGEDELAPLLTAHLLESNLDSSSNLLEMFKQNRFLYDMVSATVSSTLAMESNRDQELQNWWRSQSDNRELADNIGSAVVEIIRRDGNSEQAIRKQYEFAKTLPSGPMKSSVLTHILNTTYPDRIELTHQLLSALPQNGEFDQAISDFSFNASKHDAPTAMLWALTIKSEEARQIAVSNIANEWQQIDREAYQQWLAENKNLLDSAVLSQ